jgi:hypothetical protein
LVLVCGQDESSVQIYRIRRLLHQKGAGEYDHSRAMAMEVQKHEIYCSDINDIVQKYFRQIHSKLLGVEFHMIA